VTKPFVLVSDQRSSVVSAKALSSQAAGAEIGAVLQTRATEFGTVYRDPKATAPVLNQQIRRETPYGPETRSVWRYEARRTVL